jgi:cob(I)alamin adenosyltransferase
MKRFFKDASGFKIMRVHLGDGGETSVIGRRVKKTSEQVRVLGVLDELSAWIELCAGFCKGGDKNVLKKVRGDLYLISSCVAGGDCTVKNSDVDFLEKKSLEVDSKFKIKGFVVFTGEGCFFNIARTVCRRAEVELLGFSGSSVSFRYLNRLSTLLFSFAVKYSTTRRILLGSVRKR